MKKKSMFTRISCLVLTLSICLSCSGPQKEEESSLTFSDPTAPVGDSLLTVPATIRPILDVWMRDTYVTYGPDGYYYMTGTTATPEREFEGQIHCWDYNDGLYLWRSKDMKDWEAMGRIWSFDEDAADWQKKGSPIEPGAKSLNGDPLDSIFRAVWAPELHYIESQDKWMIAACLNGGNGSFILESTSGKPEGPYRNIAGNAEKPIFNNIDLSLFEDEDGAVYLVGHNHFIAPMNENLTDIAQPFKRIKETPYSSEPYIEGVWIEKHDNQYHLLQTVWSVPQSDGSYSYIRDDRKDSVLHSYDVVLATSDNVYGPYGPRRPAIIEGGHNNIFQGADGKWWSTIFFNPRGVMGTRFPVTCRPAVLPIKWEDGQLMPDADAADEFYADIEF
ncbi:MAG: family 43 glycosylhydrolase [Sphingobacterium sp.]